MAPGIVFLIVLGVPISLWGVYTVVSDLRTGAAEPFTRGAPLGRFSRTKRPVAYWTTMVWNACLTGFLLFSLFETIEYPQ
jgi:hypothetical protein